MISPGATIGILGGGQLGRMLAIAAAQLGYHCHIYTAEPDSIASHVAAACTQGAWDDETQLTAFANSCDVITFEWENIPIAVLEFIATLRPLHPNVTALAIAQDRLEEKKFMRDLGGQTASFAAIDSEGDLQAAIVEIGTPTILKTRRMGYDGKGQARIDRANNVEAQAASAWRAIGKQSAILEQQIAFSAEFSVILVRDEKGEIRFWDSPTNIHHHGILTRSTLPAPDIVRTQQPHARALSKAIADRLDYVGVLCCEFFATAEGVLFNEMAPRVHNSGHWTIEGAYTSQFANHIRAICGLPLGAVQMSASTVDMHNIVGDGAEGIAAVPDLLADSHCHLHLYGKAKAHPGRKIGHATWLDKGER